MTLNEFANFLANASKYVETVSDEVFVKSSKIWIDLCGKWDSYIRPDEIVWFWEYLTVLTIPHVRDVRAHLVHDLFFIHLNGRSGTIQLSRWPPVLKTAVHLVDAKDVFGSDDFFFTWCIEWDLGLNCVSSWEFSYLLNIMHRKVDPPVSTSHWYFCCE